MFLSILSAAVVALAFMAQVDHFHTAFNIAAVLILSVVLFVGLANVGRLSALNAEDARWVLAMNRIRRAYMEMHPELQPYFMTGSHDDQRGAMMTLGITMPKGGWHLGDWLHGMQTLPAMMGVIVSVVAGVWAALIGASLGAPLTAGVAVGVVVFFATAFVTWVLARRNFMRFIRQQTPVFPSDPR